MSEQSGGSMPPYAPARDEAHVVPVDDLIDHPASDGCPCGPEVKPVPREDGSMAWLMVHHSLDGRERHEHPA